MSVEILTTIPELSVQDYEFDQEHASALASLLAAAICSGAWALTKEAIKTAVTHCREVEFPQLVEAGADLEMLDLEMTCSQIGKLAETL